MGRGFYVEIKQKTPEEELELYLYYLEEKISTNIDILNKFSLSVDDKKYFVRDRKEFFDALLLILNEDKLLHHYGCIRPETTLLVTTKILRLIVDVIKNPLFSKNDVDEVSSHGKYYITASEQIIHSIEYKIMKYERDENSVRGGIAKGKKYLKYQEYINELLISKRPVHGWNSKAEVARTLYGDVSEFNKKNKNVMIDGNISRSIERWLKNVSNIKDTYIENMSDTARERMRRREKNNY